MTIAVDMGRKATKTSKQTKQVKVLMFSTHEMKYIWYLPHKSKFSFYFVLFYATYNVSPSEKGGAENAQTIFFFQIILVPEYSSHSN